MVDTFMYSYCGGQECPFVTVIFAVKLPGLTSLFYLKLRLFDSDLKIPNEMAVYNAVSLYLSFIQSKVYITL